MDGASVMISSRKQQNVQQAVEKLKEENITVAGTVCHVGKHEHRTQLIQEASFIVHCMVICMHTIDLENFHDLYSVIIYCILSFFGDGS